MSLGPKPKPQPTSGASPQPALAQATSSEQAQPRIWTTLDLIRWTKGFFEKKGIPSARLEAELLLAHVLGYDRVRLYTEFEKPVGEEPLARYREFVKRRGENREPLQYIVGESEFLDLKIKVNPAVLIPRPETEELAEWALATLKEKPQAMLEVLDLGTGSGCLALAIAAKEPRASVHAVERSPEALGVARENAKMLGLESRVVFYEGDLFAPLQEKLRGALDLLVSNPPYIDPALKETLQPEVVKHEPAAALFAEERGLAVLRRITEAASGWLKPGGRLGLELSPEQASEVRGLLEQTSQFVEIAVQRDGQGHERFVHAARK